MTYGLGKATGVRKVQHMFRAKQESESIELAVLLALSGGIMDAYSYLVRDHVFANAQTGNMLLFGVNLAAGDWVQCLHYAVPVVCFAAGIAMRGPTPRPSAIMESMLPETSAILSCESSPSFMAG